MRLDCVRSGSSRCAEKKCESMEKNERGGKRKGKRGWGRQLAARSPGKGGKDDASAAVNVHRTGNSPRMAEDPEARNTRTDTIELDLM